MLSQRAQWEGCGDAEQRIRKWQYSFWDSSYLQPLPRESQMLSKSKRTWLLCLYSLLLTSQSSQLQKNLSLDSLLLTIIMMAAIAGRICDLWCFTTMKILNPLINMISLIPIIILWYTTRIKTFNTHSLYRQGERARCWEATRELAKLELKASVLILI